MTELSFVILDVFNVPAVQATLSGGPRANGRLAIVYLKNSLLEKSYQVSIHNSKHTVGL